MEAVGSRKPDLKSGWILVTGLMLICLLGTSLTWWNYTRQVFSSADGVVIKSPSATLGSQNQETLISVTLPLYAARRIRINHGAIVTVGKEMHVLKGRVVSVNAGKSGDDITVIMELLPDPAKDSQNPVLPLVPILPFGTPCSVTIDTTVPPLDEQKQSLPQPKAAAGVTPQ